MGSAATPPGAAATDTAPPAVPGPFALWFGILAPPVVWMVRITASYVLVPYACLAGSMLPLHLVTLATLAGCAATGFLAWRSWDRVGRSLATSGADPVQRTRFMALLGVFSSAFFAVVILAEAVALLFIDPCLMPARRSVG